MPRAARPDPLAGLAGLLRPALRHGPGVEWDRRLGPGCRRLRRRRVRCDLRVEEAGRRARRGARAWLGGKIFDATGSYFGAFAVAVTALVIGVVAMWRVRADPLRT